MSSHRSNTSSRPKDKIPEIHYYIFVDGEFKSVDKESYEKWVQESGTQFNLGPFELERFGWNHFVSAFYKGDLYEHEEVMPFMVYWSESPSDELIKTASEGELYEPDLVECFATFEEAKQRYYEIVSDVKSPTISKILAESIDNPPQKN